MFIDTFAPVDKAAFSAAQKKYDKIGGDKKSAEK